MHTSYCYVWTRVSRDHNFCQGQKEIRLTGQILTGRISPPKAFRELNNLNAINFWWNSSLKKLIGKFWSINNNYLSALNYPCSSGEIISFLISVSFPHIALCEQGRDFSEEQFCSYRYKMPWNKTVLYLQASSSAKPCVPTILLAHQNLR